VSFCGKQKTVYRSRAGEKDPPTKYFDPQRNRMPLRTIFLFEYDYFPLHSECNVAHGCCTLLLVVGGVKRMSLGNFSAVGEFLY
jgi:hypothetical protein